MTQGNSWVISQQVLFFKAFKLGTRSKKNQVFSNEEALTSILAKSSTMKGISSKWVLEDPFPSLFGLLLSSKRFSGAIQSKFFSKASCIPTSLKGMGILNSSLGLVLSEVPTTSTHEPSILKRSKTFLASLATSWNSLSKVSRINSLFLAFFSYFSFRNKICIMGLRLTNLDTNI